jgi:streptogramin lyase
MSRLDADPRPKEVAMPLASIANLRLSRGFGADLGAAMFALMLLVAWSSPAAAIQRGDILVTDRGTHSLLVVDPVTGVQTVLSTGGFFSEPEAVVVNATGRIFVVEADRFGAGSKIVEVNPANGAQSVLASGGSILDPNDIAIEASGMLVVADFSGPSGLGGILRINPATGAQSVLLNGGGPFDLAVESSGQIVYTTFNFFNSLLVRFNPVTHVSATLNQDVGGAGGVAVEASGNILVSDGGSASDNAAHVFRVDPVSGARSTLTTGDAFAFRDLVVATNGSIYVVQGTSILWVDPVSGAQQTLSSNGFFQDLGGIGIYDADSPTPIATTTWGRIKQAYRGR